MKRSMVLLIAVTSLVGVYMGKQALAGCFSYCTVYDYSRSWNTCQIYGGWICQGECVVETWQAGSCQPTLNPFAGCQAIYRQVPVAHHYTYCEWVHYTNSGVYVCTCGYYWDLDMKFYSMNDCDGYTCFE
ncbi:MAG: hypothetical protein QXS01_05310 [Candidatus Bathyarchaeia archaeon]